MPNPVTILKKDHQTVKALFKEYEDLGDQAFKTKHETAMAIINELRMHAEMEESILYPFLQDKFGKEGDKMVEEAIAEHQVAKDLMDEIESLDSEHPQFDAKVKVLDENISHHVMEEEKELLPKAEKEIDAASLEAIGEQFLAFKEE